MQMQEASRALALHQRNGLLHTTEWTQFRVLSLTMVHA